MAVLVSAVLLLCGVSYSSAQCPGGCSCPAGNRLLSCSGIGAVEIPIFPASLKQTATTLNLGGNLITTIRATDLQGFMNLRTLDISDNQIDTVEDGSFSTNFALEELLLSGNALTSFPGNLFNSTFLFTLDLRDNNISNLPSQAFNGVQEGGIINLDGNSIESPNQAAFTDLQDLHQLTLTDNPIRCDCELRWFPEFRRTLTSLNMLGSCDTPPELSLASVSEDQLLCNCTPICVNGTCNTTVGVCECEAGYLGDTCKTTCPSGQFGEGCSQNCTCLSDRESLPCDHVNGTCFCLPGYTGATCGEISEQTTSAAAVSTTTFTTEMTSVPSHLLPAYGIALLVVCLSVLLLVAMTVSLALAVWLSSTSKRHLKQVGLQPQSIPLENRN